MRGRVPESKLDGALVRNLSSRPQRLAPCPPHRARMGMDDKVGSCLHVGKFFSQPLAAKPVLSVNIPVIRGFNSGVRGVQLTLSKSPKHELRNSRKKRKKTKKGRDELSVPSPSFVAFRFFRPTRSLPWIT